MKRLHLSVESNEISLVLYLYLKEFHATFSNKKKKRNQTNQSRFAWSHFSAP